MAKDIAAHYDDARGTWVLRVPFAVGATQLARACDLLLPVQIQRRQGCSPGDRRDHLDRAIAALRQRRIEQVVVGRSEVVAFQSTERMRPDRVIVDIGAAPRLDPVVLTGFQEQTK